MLVSTDKKASDNQNRKQNCDIFVPGQCHLSKSAKPHFDLHLYNNDLARKSDVQ